MIMDLLYCSIKLTLLTCLKSKMSSECNAPFYCSIVLVQHDAEKLKLFSFVASLKKSKAGEHPANAYYIWFAATGRQGTRQV